MPEILYIHDAKGALVAVQIDAALWQKIAHLVERPKPVEHGQNDMQGFAGFMAAWDFRYPYKPEVECPNCHLASENWQEDEKFALVNANIGGLLVFRCSSCGGTVRQKYFKTHMACEFTPPGR